MPNNCLSNRITEIYPNKYNTVLTLSKIASHNHYCRYMYEKRSRQTRTVCKTIILNFFPQCGGGSFTLESSVTRCEFNDFSPMLLSRITEISLKLLTSFLSHQIDHSGVLEIIFIPVITIDLLTEIVIMRHTSILKIKNLSLVP